MAEYWITACVTKIWALGLSLNTSKAELPYGFKRLQLPCYRPQQHPTKLTSSMSCHVPHFRDRRQGLLNTLVQGGSERQTGKLWD